MQTRLQMHLQTRLQTLSDDIDKAFDLLQSNQKEKLRCDLCERNFIEKKGFILNLYDKHLERLSELLKKHQS